MSSHCSGRSYAAPAPCSATRTTGCLLTSDSQTWNRLFAGATGLIDNVSVLAVRDGSFKPLPFGSQLVSDTHGIHQPEFYVQDVWRIRPTGGDARSLRDFLCGELDAVRQEGVVASG